MPRIRDIATVKTSGELVRSDKIPGDPSTGATFGATLGALQDWLIANTGAHAVRIPMTYFGDLVVDELYGGFEAPYDLDILGMEHSAQVVPTGANAGFDLVDENGDSYSKASALDAGERYQKTTFGSVLSLDAGDFVATKVTAKGSTIAGGYISSYLLVRPRLA